MAGDCGSKCAKFVLFTFNILIWICGAIVLGVGIWFMVDENALKFIHVATVDMNSDLMRGASITMIVVGALAFIVGFFGCCGACKENTCMLQSYAVILIFLIVLQVIAGIVAGVFRGKISEEIGDSMNKTVQTLYQFNGEDETTKAFDFTQTELKCCGAEGPADWSTSDWRKASGTQPVPESCCVMDGDEPLNVTLCYEAANNPDIPNAATYLHVQGCEKSLHEWVDSHAAILIGVAVGLAVVQMLNVILACCLRKRVQSQYQYV